MRNLDISVPLMKSLRSGLRQFWLADIQSICTKITAAKVTPLYSLVQQHFGLQADGFSTLSGRLDVLSANLTQLEKSLYSQKILKRIEIAEAEQETEDSKRGNEESTRTGNNEKEFQS